PCVRCNQTVKFADLTALAAGLGCERLATGHYVRRIDGRDGPELHRAADLARDQSWFLFATTRAQLAVSLFPLGEIADKRTVRSEAERLGLPVAAKPDSQDLCFVPSGHYADLAMRLRPDAGEPGDIVSRDGRVLGRHSGIAHYTVGQGKRLGTASMDRGQRQMVLALDADRRRVVIGPRGAGTRSARLREMNWLIQEPTHPLVCQVKLRARDELQSATVCPISGGYANVVFDAVTSPAPGQACVFYDGTRVLGGGMISRAAFPAMVDAGGASRLSPVPSRPDGGVAQR
ncbi:MAG TPA: aminomethyltransferase beta-barrel domain-containing protein, partial [Acetobacteraceae bacterium]|nr:aminomethyltransferase beta-barrel domain-containing protein [Acetobacteraceae bacterium]